MWRTIPAWLVVGRILGYHGEIPRWHGNLIVSGCSVGVAWVLVEESQESLVSLMIEVVDLVPAREKIRDGLGWWLVHDCGRDNIGHIAMVVLGRDVQRGVRIESPKSREMNIAAKYSNANTICAKYVNICP